LPKYLIDFFDNEVDKFKKREFYRNRAIQRYKYSNEDKKKYYKERDEEFWKTNKYELVKKEKRLGKHLDPVYKEPDRNTKILDDEKDLSPEDIKMLIAMCSEFHKYVYNYLTNNINQRKKYSRGFKHAIAAPRSHAKCVKYDTNIQLYNGEIKKIKDIAVGDCVLSINDDLKLKKDKIVSKVYSGKKRVRDIIFDSGRTISITDNHRLFNIHGEVCGSNIKIGDKLALPRRLPCYIANNSMKDEEAVFLANIIAEGCLSKTAKLKKSKGYSFSTTYTNFDKEVVDDFKNACAKLGFEIEESKRKGHYRIRGATKYLRDFGLGGCLSTEKLIPDKVFKQNNKFLSLFISRFIATDGWISKYSCAAGITLANEKLVDQLFTIFLRLGFRPYKQDKPNNKSGAWAVVIHGIDQMIKLSKFDLLHKNKKLENTINKFKSAKRCPNFDTIDKEWKKYLKNITPYFLRTKYSIRVDNNKHNTTRDKLNKVADIDNNKYLKNLANSDIFWDRVKSISDYYDTDTYDIETEKYHNFVANNVLSHNSSIISTILPLWCIAYNKKKFILIISDTVNQAIDFLSDVKREIDHNVLLQRDFPHIVGKGPTWKQDEIITNNDIKLMALGTKSKVRGRKYGVHRPDLVINDDLENSDMVRSETEREWIRYQWFDKDLMHIHGEKGTFTDILVVGTSVT